MLENSGRRGFERGGGGHVMYKVCGEIDENYLWLAKVSGTKPGMSGLLDQEEVEGRVESPPINSSDGGVSSGPAGIVQITAGARMYVCVCVCVCMCRCLPFSKTQVK